MRLDLVRLDAADGDADIATGGSRPLALVGEGIPPTEYLMFGPGVNETVKGPLLFDDEAAAAVLAFYEGRGRKRLAGDWEHDSMVPAGERPPGYRGSPASHWFDLDVRPGPELWATSVKWTPTAFAQIQAGEYAHTSPVVKFQKNTGRIMAVLSSALTNDPATIGQPQLVAATADTLTPPIAAPKESNMYKMPDEPAMKMKALVDGEHADEKEMCGKMVAHLTENFPESMKKDDNEPPIHDPKVDPKADPAAMAKMAADEEEKKDAKELRAALTALTGKSSNAEILATVTVYKDANEEVATLTAKANAANGTAFESLVAKGRADKKLTPADCAAGSKTKLGGRIAAWRKQGDEGVLSLSATLDALTPRVTTVETALTEGKGAELNDLATVTLTAAEEHNCKLFGGADVAGYRKRMLAIKQERIAERNAAITA